MLLADWDFVRLARLSVVPVLRFLSDPRQGQPAVDGVAMGRDQGADLIQFGRGLRSGRGMLALKTLSRLPCKTVLSISCLLPTLA